MKTHNGFSLIELAIVLIIIGFLMGFLLIPISAKKDQQYLKSTQKTLEEIKEALLGFAVRERRLPCADKDDDGDEDPPCDTNNVEGSLPWKDLKVGRYDVWGQPFRYRVDGEYSLAPISSSLETDENNKLKVRNLQQAPYYYWTTLEEYESGGTKYSRVIAIIFSEGKNHKADKGNKLTAANDATYVHDGYVEDQDDPNNNFDDILTWLSRNTLMNRLTTAKRWPPDP